MKRKNNLYNNILNYENLLKMYKVIKKNCKKKQEVYKFSLNLNQNLLDIIKLLSENNYKFDKYRIFLIREPKYRLIMSERIQDKIVNHLVAKYILLPALDDSLIDSNVATRYNKGSGYAFNLFIKYVNRLLYLKRDIYVLKVDISKYFYNIDHEILFNLLQCKIKDVEALNIIKEVLNTTNEEYVNVEIRKIIDKEIERVKNLNISDYEKSLKINELNSIPIYKYNKGLPIGNMTSQILAVFYLNKIDHYIKEDLQLKNYIRYMDDFIIMDTDIEKLKYSFEQIKIKLLDFKLSSNRKSNIYNLKNGVTFLGYTFKVSNKLIIKYNSSTSKRIIRRLKNLKEFNYDKYLKSKGSYKGYLEKSNTSFYKELMEKI